MAGGARFDITRPCRYHKRDSAIIQRKDCSTIQGVGVYLEYESTLFASDGGRLLRQLVGELDNFEGIAKYLLPQPGEVPKLQGIDVWGGTLPFTGAVGGDHIIYVDFKQRFDLDARIKHATEKGRQEVVQNLLRCQQTAGIAMIDVSGHQATDAVLAAMLHQAFLLGSLYELDISGQITRRL